MAGLIGGTPSLLYPTSKGAVVNMTRAMAAHHGVEGIRVNCVAPGMVYTPMVAGRMTPEVRELRRKRSLLQIEGSGWDVGQAVAYLASDEARWVTGVILPVDAGTMAGSAPSPGLQARHAHPGLLNRTIGPPPSTAADACPRRRTREALSLSKSCRIAAHGAVGPGGHRRARALGLTHAAQTTIRRARSRSSCPMPPAARPMSWRACWQTS